MMMMCVHDVVKRVASVTLILVTVNQHQNKMNWCRILKNRRGLVR